MRRVKRRSEDKKNFIYRLMEGDWMMIDTAIKFFNANKDNDIAVYMMFSSLVSDAVYLPVNECGYLMSLSLGENEVIPIFTSKAHVPSDEPIELRECFIENYIDMLLKVKRHMIINPFSDENVQFIIPYDAIERFLIPVIQEQKKKHE